MNSHPNSLFDASGLNVRLDREALGKQLAARGVSREERKSVYVLLERGNTTLEAAIKTVQAGTAEAGTYKVSAYHQHYSRGPRYYDRDCVPAVSYGPASSCLMGERVIVGTLHDAQLVADLFCRTKHLGKHGGVRVERVA